MRDSRFLFIIDTNVLIDLHRGGILRQLFTLPYTFGASDVIIEDLEDPDGGVLMGYGLK